MSPHARTQRRIRPTLAGLAGLGLALSGLAVLSTPASAASAGLVISEVYGGGGNSGATLTHDFIELHNPTDAPITVDGLSVQYRSSGNGGTGVTALSGTVPAGGYYLVQEAQGKGGTQPLPEPDATGSLSMSGSNGIVFLAEGTAAVTLPDGDASGLPGVIDLVGYGSTDVYEGAPTGVSLTSTTSAQRVQPDTDHNADDFDEAAPDPESSGGGGGEEPPEEPEDPTEATIAEIQGTGADSQLAGQLVTTTGVVTAAYPTGGFDGMYVQTGGSGGVPDATPGASDGIFVYGDHALPDGVTIGDSVQVTGTVSEFRGLTEITPDAGGVVELAEALPPVTPRAVVPGTECALPGGDCPDAAAIDDAREAHEGELFRPTGAYTVTDVYDGSAFTGSGFSSAFYGEIGLAAESTRPLVTPTEVVDAQDTAGIAARTAYNDAHRVILDDGSSWNYASDSNRDEPFPWFTEDHTVRVGAAVTFEDPVVLDYRFGWKLQPQRQVVGVPEGIAFEQDRPAAPRDVGGDLRLATFNVLNYFTTLGEDVEGCSYYDDRFGNPTTVNRCPGDNGPRGAWDEANFERQQAKIVDSINTLDADIVSLEEIENSLTVDGHDRDEALAALVDALNAAAGETRWAYVPSPADVPATEDVIRTAFIYDPATVEPVGEGAILDAPAFDNARDPLAQTFAAVDAAEGDGFVVIANHFKSKGSGVDDGTGQGNANPDRIAQAEALVDFADDFAAAHGVEKIFLTGDFNAYSMEDPVQVITGAGYTSLEDRTAPAEESYNFDGMVGSLDHIFANEAALADVTGVDVWTSNAYESVYYEYSRYNANVTDLYAPGPFRASDHNPEIVGIRVEDRASAEITARHTPRKVKVDKTRAKLRVRVTAEGAVPTGTVEVTVGGTTYTEVLDKHGRATVRLPAFEDRGEHTVVIRYSGDDEVAPATLEHTVQVVR